MNPDDMRAIMGADGFIQAEKLTGKSYKEDKVTESLGIYLTIANNQQKAEVLKDQKDTYFSISIYEYLNIIERYGFHKIYQESFVDDQYGEHHTEKFYVFWKDGILLNFDSHRGHVNGGKFHYNWKPTCDKYPWVLSSGSFDNDGIWAGDHDCREALKYNISQLEQYGQILPVWKRRPWLKLLNYMEWKPSNCDSVGITEKKISKFPDVVRTAIKG